MRKFHADLILYVVDGRQSLHFIQVFRAVHKTGYAGKAQMEHISFGTMNGADGKPFKTRAGGTMKLKELIAMLINEAKSRMNEADIAKNVPPEKQKNIAKQVGLAALKFADLQHERTQDYIFDLKRFSNLEGKTGPYIQYAAVRIKSLLQRAHESGFEIGPIQPANSDSERGLVLTLAKMSDAIWLAYEKRQPHILCDFAYTLAQKYSYFYQTQRFLSETDIVKRASYLALNELTLRQFVLILDLLGIEVPDNM